MTLVGKIAQILNETKFVLNIGSKAGVEIGQKFIIYQEGDEVFDPTTKVSLGKLELSKGTIIVEHVQEKLSIAVTQIMETQTLSKTLSELMVEASVQTEPSRKKLTIKKQDLNPQGRISPVQIGDCVRSVP